MQPITVVTICLCLAMSIEAQRPKPCASPPLLEGALSVMDAKFVQVVSGIFSYDGLGQKFRIRENVSVAGSSFALDTLFLFREHIQYKIFYQNQTCVRSPLDTRFRPLEVPPDAQFLTQMVVGGSSQPGEGVLGNQWTGKIPETKGTYYTLVSEFGCLPLSDLYYDAHGLWITTFYDLITGIRDPNVFIPPSFCDKGISLEAL